MAETPQWRLPFGGLRSLLTSRCFKPGHHVMSLTRRRALALATAFAGTAARPAHAQQNWPQRPLRMLIGTSPGGSPDIVGRVLADRMSERLGQTVTVENNTGGGG